MASVEKPPQGKRELIIRREVYERMLELLPEEAHQDLLKLAWETGARPQELLALEARHLELDRSRAVFPASEAKGKRYVRIIHLTDKAASILSRLVLRYPEGKLLRNSIGIAWTTSACSSMFGRVKKVLGVKYCLYNFRHSFCHRAIKNEVDPVTVANLMGHRNTAMVAQVYSNLGQDQAYLAKAMKRAVG